MSHSNVWMRIAVQGVVAIGFVAALATPAKASMERESSAHLLNKASMEAQAELKIIQKEFQKVVRERLKNEEGFVMVEQDLTTGAETTRIAGKMQ